MDAAKLTVDGYFNLPETCRPMELLFGVVHEPPAPNYSHQVLVMRLAALLDRHVRRLDSGRVCISPIDVVFDRAAALVLQPDVIFVSNARLSIIGDRIWGAPDLTVEVLSPGTARRDRTLKIGWYRQYGVRESWLIDPVGRAVEILMFDVPDAPCPPAIYERESRIRSRVLPRLRLRASSLFEP